MKIKQTLNNELKVYDIIIYYCILSAMNHVYSRINYVHSPDGELLCGSVRE